MHADGGRTPVRQLRERGAGVGARADQQDGGPGPEVALGRGVGETAQLLREVQGDGDDRAAGRAERRAGADVLGRARGGLEEADERARGGAGLLGRRQGASDLTGDLALAHHGGVQSGADLEEVTGRGVGVERAERGVHVLVRQGGGGGDGGQQPRAGGLDAGRVGLGVDLHAVARGQHDGARRAAAGQGGPDPGRAGAEAGDRVQVQVMVGGDEREDSHSGPSLAPTAPPVREGGPDPGAAGQCDDAHGGRGCATATRPVGHWGHVRPVPDPRDPRGRPGTARRAPAAHRGSVTLDRGQPAPSRAARPAPRPPPRVVHAAGRPFAARVPPGARGDRDARLLPHAGPGPGDHDAAGAPP